MTTRAYKPSLKSLGGALVYDLVPLVPVGIVGWYLDWKFDALFWCLSAGMGLLSLWMIWTTLVVHLGQSLEVFPEGIRFLGSGGVVVEIRWADIQSKVLRRRKNALTRDDHLLQLDSAVARIMFVTSVLSEEDEAELLALLRGQGPPLLDQDDHPAV